MEDAEEYCIDGDTEEEKKKPRPIIKNAMDLQRLKLEKLMKNPDKPIIIPEQPKEKDFMQTVPTFVRNVMGSSAGAGSGEFHVYRHLRRKEYARQKFIQAKSIREQLDDDYRHKLEKNKAESDAKTAKKRAKRLKRKQKIKQKGKKRRKDTEDDQNMEPEVSEDEESDEDEKDDESTATDKEEQPVQCEAQLDKKDEGKGDAEEADESTVTDKGEQPDQVQESDAELQDKKEEGTEATKDKNNQDEPNLETEKVADEIQGAENNPSQRNVK